MLIDLQLHSNYSDGYLAPSEIASLIGCYGVKAASLTDHNTLGGQGEFRRECLKRDIRYIPGLELYVTLGRKKFNILWYNFEDDPRLHGLLRESKIRRKNQARKILLKLKSKGLAIDVERALDRFAHYVPINRLVDELWRIPTNKQILRSETGSRSPREDDIIRTFFKNKRYGILHESYLDIQRILELRRKIGGQIILNHPGKYRVIQREFWTRLKKFGFDGVELLSPHHSIDAIMRMQQLAKELRLITTGGSDFHRFEAGGHPLQHAHEYFRIDSKKLRGISKIIGS